MAARTTVALAGMVLAVLLTACTALAAGTRQHSDINAWLCIHRYEGSWQDGGAPFWGGLQMNWRFMATYGPPVLLHMRSTPYSQRLLFRRYGTADHWTPAQQIAVARYARDHGRGYWPWPNTARVCGLL